MVEVDHTSADGHAASSPSGDAEHDAFGDAFDLSPIGLAVVALDGSLLRVNPTLCELIGYPASDFASRMFQELTHPDDLDGDVTLAREVLAGIRPTYSVDKRYVHRDGSIVHTRQSVSLVRWADGRPRHFIAQIEDRTDAVAAQRMLEAVVEQMSDQIYVIGPDGRYSWASPSAVALFGVDDFEGAAVGRFMHPDDRDAIVSEMAAALAGTAPIPERRTFRVWSQALEEWRWLEATVSDRTDDPLLGGLLVCSRDVTQREADAAALRHQALHDDLTGLPTRALLVDRVDGAARRAARSGTEIAVLFFDVDHFKQVNDTLGHAAGDRLLIEVAERVRSRLRAQDTLGRLGGDEFVVVLEGLGEQPEAAVSAICDDLVDALAEPMDLDGRRVRMSSSIGVVISDGTDDAEELLRAADEAMYATKASGRGRWLLHTEAMSTAARARFDSAEDELTETGPVTVRGSR